MARKEKYAQGEDAGKIIEFILRRKDAYYGANVTKRWKDACGAIINGLEQRFTPEEEDLTRSKFFLTTMINADDGYNETFVNAYGLAQKLFVFNTKRVGTKNLAERAEWLMANVWEESAGDKSWLGIMRDQGRFGMGVSRQQWDLRHGTGVGYEQTKQPWGMMATVALQNKKLWERPFAKRFHPFDWFGYWRQAEDLPWEGLLHVFGTAELLAMLEADDEDYLPAGVKAALGRLKRGSGPKDENYHGTEEEDAEDIPDENTLQGFEYWGTLYGCPGHEKDTKEYQVILTDQEILKKQCNTLEGFRPIKRTRGIPQNDWCGGRPLLLPQIPHLKMENLFANSMIDDVLDRLYAGWAMWEHALVNPDEFMNPEGLGAPVRMNKDAGVAHVPVRIGGGQSGIQADTQRINELVDRDRMAGNFQDVLSQKGGIQDGTARAANLVASQGARKAKAVMINANESGLVGIAAQLLILKFINTEPSEMARQTRDEKEFQISPDEWSLLLENNLWSFHDSFRRDPYIDTDNMERFAKVGAVEFMAKHASDPMITVEFWREFANNLNIRNYDRFLPLEMPKPPQAQSLPPELAAAAGAAPPEAGAEVPEGMAA